MIIPKSFRGSIVKSEGIEEVLLHLITSEEAKSKKHIGTAYGMDLFHCWYLSQRHGGEEAARAKWYVASTNQEDQHLKEMRIAQPSTIRVDFYGPFAKEEQGANQSPIRRTK